MPTADSKPDKSDKSDDPKLFPDAPEPKLSESGDFIVILSTPGRADPFKAVLARGASAEEAALSTGGHFVNVRKDDGAQSIVHEENGEKYALLVERPAAA